MTDDELLWVALANPHRRKILDLLKDGPMTTGAISEKFEFTRFAIMKHLTILVDANLVIIHRRGRERLNFLNPVPIQHALRRWLKPFDEIAAERLNELKDTVERNEDYDK